MKLSTLFLASMFLLGLAIGLRAQTWEPPPEADAPGWYTAQGALWYRYLYWDGLGTYDDDNCNYCASPCGCGACDVLQGEAQKPEETLFISIGNCADTDNYKRVFAYVRGDGDPPAVNDISVISDETVIIRSVTVGDTGPGWWVRVEASIVRQPDNEMVQIILPSGSTMTECWAGSRCFDDDIRTIILGCDELGELTLSWDPAPPEDGDLIKVRNETIDVVRNIKFNGVLKVGLLPLQSTTGFIGRWAAGSSISGCARCSGEKGLNRGPLGCFVSGDLSQPTHSVTIDYECGLCGDEIPTLTEWGLIILTLILLATMTYVFIKKKRLGQLPM